MVKNDLERIQKKLIELTKRWISIHGYGKSEEPCIHIGITNTNDWTWFAEIYSYHMDFEDGGRHHYFYADTYEELIKKIWEAIKLEEEIVTAYEIAKIIEKDLKEVTYLKRGNKND